MKKYIITPGYVRSKNDDDLHFINSKRLMHLYGVKQTECYFMTEEDYERKKHMSHLKDLQVLAPRFDGNYSLIKPTEQEG